MNNKIWECEAVSENFEIWSVKGKIRMIDSKELLCFLEEMCDRGFRICLSDYLSLKFIFEKK